MRRSGVFVHGPGDDGGDPEGGGGGVRFLASAPGAWHPSRREGEGQGRGWHRLFASRNSRNCHRLGSTMPQKRFASPLAHLSLFPPIGASEAILRAMRHIVFAGRQMGAWHKFSKI